MAVIGTASVERRRPSDEGKEAMLEIPAEMSVRMPVWMQMLLKISARIWTQMLRCRYSKCLHWWKAISLRHSKRSLKLFDRLRSSCSSEFRSATEGKLSNCNRIVPVETTIRKWWTQMFIQIVSHKVSLSPLQRASKVSIVCELFMRRAERARCLSSRQAEHAVYSLGKPNTLFIQSMSKTAFRMHSKSEFRIAELAVLIKNKGLIFHRRKKKKNLEIQRSRELTANTSRLRTPSESSDLVWYSITRCACSSFLL